MKAITQQRLNFAEKDLMPNGEPTINQTVEMHEYAQQIYANTMKMFASENK